MGLLADLAALSRYAWGLRGFLRRPLSLAQSEAMIRRGVAHRAANFLRLLERGVFGHSKSPYLPLLKRAGCELGDVAVMVRRDGLEEALRALHQAGVYISYEEFKGRRPIVRGTHVQPVQAADFVNPLLARHYEARTGGSRGTRTRLFVDLDLVTEDAASYAIFLEAFGLGDRPFALWRPLPPGVTGLLNMLRHARLGRPVRRWFTQSTPCWSGPDLRNMLVTYATVHGSRWCGRALPGPEPVPLARASRVARWLATQKAQGTPALLDTNASSGVRVCQAALHDGLDIGGTFFRLGGEPFTAAKAQVVAAAGCRAASYYSMSELGRVGIACAAPAAPDDVHLLANKLAVFQHAKPVGRNSTPLPCFVFTTLHPSASMLMLNVESDDYGVLEERDCGCRFAAVGLHRHIHTIRSYEKLTSEGMTFYGSDVFKVIEEVLPARFGGQPTDYQFLETEEGGLPRVSIVVSPRVGTVDEAAVLATVVGCLRECPDGPMMTERWEQGQTLRVIRQVPYVTPAWKTLPLHVLRKHAREGEAPAELPGE